MNEPRSLPNESDHEDRMTKKDFKEMKVITFRGSIIGIVWLNILYLEQFDLLGNLLKCM